ncbi:MAG: hypothetical protein WCD07_12480 [Burkholderiales bacterium]
MKSLSLKHVLFFGLLATLVAAWFAPSAEKEDNMLSDRSKNIAGKPRSKSEFAGSKASAKTKSEPQVMIIRPRLSDMADDSRLFNSTYWTPPIKPTPIPVQVGPVPSTLPVPLPTPEVAPAIPFKVLGRYEDAGQITVFVQFNEQNLAIRAGDTVVGKYKVENISATAVELLYIPLNQPQTLPISGSK